MTNNVSKEVLIPVLKEQFEAFLAKDIGVKREILDRVSGLVAAPQIMVITGLRRAGKSTLLAQIAAKYLKDKFYFVNFEDERLSKFLAGDFDLLHEALIGLFGERKIFLFDEIQNVPEWERFVRRLHDQGYKFIVTGSNASLLSQELGTRLTGRSIRIEVYPFSFGEFLSFKKAKEFDFNALVPKQRSRLIKLVDEYLILGGIPDSLKYPELEIHKTLYDDVLYRDVAARYHLGNIKELKDLAFFLASNASSLISFNKIKELLKLGSVNTVKSYIDYLENSWLFFTINKYAYSVKEQQIAAKKIYGVDTGLIKSVGFDFSPNSGKLMENAIYLQLRRKYQYQEIYYYKTDHGYETDFFLPKENLLIQSARDFDAPETQERELRALVLAAQEQKRPVDLLVVTHRAKQKIKKDNYQINVIPLYEWLLR
ncbi:MAG: ATP-binding protein [Minisyncoccales bacterium]